MPVAPFVNALFHARIWLTGNYGKIGQWSLLSNFGSELKEAKMACWLYQMNNKIYSHERYRTEVWEGHTVTNWSIGESKRKPKEVLPGDIVILFFVRAGADEPGIYGWGVITLFDKEVIDFRPASPSDYLKMNPVPEEEVIKVVNKIRGRMPEGTMWPVDREELEHIRQKIAEHVYRVSS